MKVKISLFLVIFLVIIIHTIFQHLLNWGWRNIKESDVGFMVVFTVGELIILLSLLNEIL